MLFFVDSEETDVCGKVYDAMRVLFGVGETGLHGGKSV